MKDPFKLTPLHGIIEIRHQTVNRLLISKPILTGTGFDEMISPMLKINRYEKIAAELQQDQAMVRFVSKGQSMEPLLKDGDEIIVKRVSADELRFGDLITYKSNGIFITHRFFYRRKINQNLFLMAKADNRLKPDTPVSSSFLVGKVVGVKSHTLSQYVLSILSLAEWKLLEAILWIKRMAFKNLRIHPSMKQHLANYVRKSKQWLFGRILDIQKIPVPQLKHE